MSGTAARRRITLLVLDVDGVLTDGTVLLLPTGEDVRAIHFHDLDAVARLRRRGVEVATLSGEDNPGGHRVAQRFAIAESVWGARDKLPAFEQLCRRLGRSPDEACYVGDADRDAPALAAAGLGLAPAGATAAARAAADLVLEASGGRGAVAEAVSLLERAAFNPPGPEASP